MARELPPEMIDKTVRGIPIPSRPEVLAKLDKELASADPDPRVVGRLIGADVGLAAAVLRTVNSPFFGLTRKISSVEQAVNLLGMRSATQIVTGLMVRTAVSGKGNSFERFWDSAEKVAAIASTIALTVPRGPRDEAYCFGLFHDIGIPILLQKFPEYRQTLALAEGTDNRPLTTIEEERHATNHATLGYLVAKAWFLPEAICEAILSHHDTQVFDDRDALSPRALTLIAINALAEHLHDEYGRLRPNKHWHAIGEQALDHLGLTDDEYRDLRHEATLMLR